MYFKTLPHVRSIFVGNSLSVEAEILHSYIVCFPYLAHKAFEINIFIFFYFETTGEAVMLGGLKLCVNTITLFHNIIFGCFRQLLHKLCS